jgi:pyruvate formate lyase activating enzyme
MDRLMDQASPAQIAQAAARQGCRSVAFTYNDPVIFAEYAMDVAAECRARDIRTVVVTAGYIHDVPRREFFAQMDAANVDLKAFTDTFYYRTTGARLAPVLDTLRYLCRETSVWVEITTLLIPGANDSDAELTAMSEWIASELGPHVPLHFTAFHPDYRMLDVEATPLATLLRARRIAHAAGLAHVYVGNVRHTAAETTYCTGCSAPLVTRQGYRIADYALTREGACPGCGTPLAGRFEAFDPARQFGPRRIPVRLEAC